MAVSANFLGNFWRFAAIISGVNYLFKANAQGTSMSFVRVSRRLEMAEKAYMVDENSWGLGLTYNMLGELYSIKSQSHHEDNFIISMNYFLKSISHFEKCQHYRGCCTAAQNLTKICE
jgi:hypothetical protein